MYRVIELRHKYYALKISSVEEDAENIETFAREGNWVIIVSDLSNLSDFGIDESDVEIVEPD